MIIFFPNHGMLQLALTSGIIPDPVARSAVQAHEQPDVGIWVQPSESLSRRAALALDQLGAKLYKRVSVPLDESLTCWSQLLPVARRAQLPEIGSQTTVLFEVDNDRRLPELVNEILRLGNDRQSFRSLESGTHRRTWLRVVGPPYYTLLRLLDRGQSETALRAYVEQHPRVWVELGCTHPLAEQLQPAAGQWLLMRPQREWELVEEGRFRDLYEVTEFKLPEQAAVWQPSDAVPRIEVPVRLAATDAREPAELWVVRQRSLEQLEQLVRRADDQLLSQLAFAVVGEGEQATVVLRARPSRQSPPILVLDAIGFRSYLKLPQLFLPVGMRLNPPLRRDAVARLFPADGDQITWLVPDEAGRFAAEGVSERAFRPLLDWVDYVIDSGKESLQAWVASYRFDFDGFVCHDELPAGRQEATKEEPATQRHTATESSGGSKPQRIASEPRELADLAALLDREGQTPEPNELQQRLHQLEQQFRESLLPPDADERSRWWREMGRINGRLGHRQDTTVCWSNGLWEDSRPSAGLVDAWVSSENADSLATAVDPDDVLIWISDVSSPVNASRVVAALVQAAQLESPGRRLVENLGAVSQYLERQESYLPVRTAWLGWLAVSRLAHGDTLSLARARDRLLEQLFQHGLRPEYDVPIFLRNGGSSPNDRFRLVRERILSVYEAAQAWLVATPSGETGKTRAYADLLFAFALARCGETTECHRLTTRGDAALPGSDPVHKWLREAFGQRIEQALNGHGFQVPLSETLIERLAGMDRLDRYKIDRLRQQSTILEPHERIDPYRRWHRRYEDDLGRQLAGWHDETDRDELSREIFAVLERQAGNPSNASRVLSAALELAPRVGEKAALQWLDRVLPVFHATRDQIDQALLLGRGLLIAAHYGALDLVPAFIEQFEKLLATIVTAYLTVASDYQREHKEQLRAFEDLFASSFVGLRRLGMRDQVGRLFGPIAELVDEQLRDLNRARRKTPPLMLERANSRARRLLLVVAGSRYYFGQAEAAERVVEETRRVLFEGQNKPMEQRELACSYVAAIGQAPIQTTLPLVLELFELDEKGRRKLSGVEDALTTASHFSVSQLDLIETIVMSLVGDGLALDADMRRWLDEDEYLVRRRIHRDMHTALASPTAIVATANRARMKS